MEFMIFQILEKSKKLKKLIKVFFSFEIKISHHSKIDDRRRQVEENPKFLDEEKVKEKVEREKDEDL